jgi:hypothetical protein
LHAYFVASGGLISYGADFVDQYRRAAAMSTAFSGREARRPAGASADQVRDGIESQDPQKSLGLTIPQSLVSIADEVIE